MTLLKSLEPLPPNSMLFKPSLLVATLVLGGLSSGVAVGGPGMGVSSVVQELTEAQLVGTWKGTTGAHRKRILVVAAGGSCTLDGVAGTWSLKRSGELRVRAGSESFPGDASRKGKGLVVEINGKRSRFRLQAEAKDDGFQEMAGGSGDGVQVNAAGDRSKPDFGFPFPQAPKGIEIGSWAGLYRSGAFELLVGTTGPAGVGGALQGEMLRGRSRWGFTLVPTERGATGCFSPKDGSVAFEVTKSRTGLTLHFGSQRLVFTRSKSDAVQPMPGATAPPLPKLKGVASAPAQTYTDPQGYYSFDMPKDWSAESSELGLVVNPGFKPTDTLDALIIVGTGRLEPGDLHRAPTAIIDRDERELRQSYTNEGIRLQAPRRPAQAVQVGSYPGAVQEWKGTLANGTKVEVWLGAASAKGYYITVAAILAKGRENEFLPDVKRILATMEVNPPDRRPELERQFAGRRISQTSNTDSGSFSTIYEFRADGSVSSRSLFSGSIGLDMANGETTDIGTYAVVGEVLYMTFPISEQSHDLTLQGSRVTGVKMGGRVRSLE